MSIADWFRPRWQHSNPAVRLAAVEELTDQCQLEDIARNAKDVSVRETAMKRLKASRENDELARVLALRRLRESLGEACSRFSRSRVRRHSILGCT
jgi:hypothetical protein